MKDLFEKLKKEGEKCLKVWKTDEEIENLYLDFKELSSVGRKTLNNDDKKIIGKALSGFSNSEGGTIVWGVDARSGAETGIDTIQKLKPFDEFKRFKTIIYDLAVQLVRPQNPNIEICSFPSKNKGKGYIALWIGRGVNRPYQSGKDHCFYKRSGGSFNVMERFEIEDMFKAQATPILKVGHSVRFGEVKQTPCKAERFPGLFIKVSMTINITVENISGIFAEGPILSILDVDGIGSPSGKIIQKKPPLLIPTKNLKYLSMGFYEDDNSLHPGQTKIFQCINLQIFIFENDSIWFRDNGADYRNAPEISIFYDISCKNFEKVEGKYIIRADELHKMAYDFSDENHAEIVRNFTR